MTIQETIDFLQKCLNKYGNLKVQKWYPDDNQKDWDFVKEDTWITNNPNGEKVLRIFH